MNTEMKEYRGMEVEVAGVDGTCCVAHVDRTKGITIHNEDDKEVWCLNREQFLGRSEYSFAKRNYHEIFSRVLTWIDSGVVGDFLHWRNTGEVIYYPKGLDDIRADTFTCAYK